MDNEAGNYSGVSMTVKISRSLIREMGLNGTAQKGAE